MAVTSTTPQANEPYKRVYADWKPTTTSIERGESESPQESMSKEKDDVPSKSDKMRGSHSSTSLSSSTTPLQSILEEDRRTSQETPLKINIRRPSETSDYEPVYQKHNTTSPVGITSDSHSIYIRPSAKKSVTSPESITKCHALDADLEPLSNKIEIDSDNIETPPVVRKNLGNDDKLSSSGSVKKLQAPRPLHQRTIDESNANEGVEGKINDSEVLGDGHFDRHSSARRTRRYRRPTDHSSGNEDRNDSSPETVPPNPLFPTSNALYGTELDIIGNSSKDDVSPDREDDTLSKSKSMDILSRIGKHGRNMSSINQEAVREAIRKLKSPTETPERIWSPPREIVVNAKDRIIPSKGLNHELNDEGFEETQSCQSLVSDGKDSTSSCNEPAEQAHLSTSALSPNQPKTKLAVKTLMERNRQSLERSRSLRAASTNVTPHSRTSVIPKRTNSLRRSVDTGPMASSKQDVERSGSRTSLRSSRSSLNSSASINTVRNMGIKSSATQSPSTTRHMPNSAADKTTLRKKLVQQQSSPSANTQKSTLKGSNSLNSYLRTPASRSSSSGSSIGGPSSRQSYTKTSSSNSVTPPISNSPQRPAFRNTVSVSSNSQPSPSARSSSRLNNLKGIASKTSNRVSSFMRPTTSSATKVNSSNNRSK